MSYTVKQIKKSIAYCGLVCTLCNEGKQGKCSGCKEKCNGCTIKICCQDKKIQGCWECKEFPCNEDLLKNKRNRAFLLCAKEEEAHKLAQYLKKNHDNGILYHREDGSPGDYDNLNDEDEILYLLRKESPYEKCPVYETKQFIFRLVEIKDAEELLECYSDDESAKIFNSDDCTSNFIYKSLVEMENCIKLWIDEYKKQYYLRFSIIDKIRKKAIGTIEIFKKEEDFEIGKTGVLRLDLPSQYEKEEFIEEIIDVINNNFYNDFDLDCVLTKAIPLASQRIQVLKNRGFIEFERDHISSYNSYFIRVKQ